MINNLKTWLKISFFATVATSGHSAQSSWYISAFGGYSSGWKADKNFIFASAPAGGVSVNPPPLTQTVSSKSKPIADFALGYVHPSENSYRFKAEIEGLYLPQEFVITTTGAPVYYTDLSGLVYHSKHDDAAYLANFGVCVEKLSLSPSLVFGVGRNRSGAAKLSPVWQAKAGLNWKLGEGVSLTAEIRYLRVSEYVVSGTEFGPYSVGKQYDFGSLDSVSGTLGLKVSF